MRKSLSLPAAALIAAGLLLVGCDNSETKSTTSTPTPPSSAAPATPSGADAAKAKADTAAQDTADAAQPAGEKVGDAATTAKDTAADAASATAKEGEAAADAAQTAATTKADDLLTQVTTYIKENKMDLAEKALKQLEDLKPNLPASYQSKIDSARTAFDTAKKGQGLKDSLLGK